MKTIENITYNNFKIAIEYDKSKYNPRKKLTNIFKFAFLSNDINIGDKIISNKKLYALLQKNNIKFAYIYIKKDSNNNIHLLTTNYEYKQSSKLIGLAYIDNNINKYNEYDIIKLLRNELYEYQLFLNNVYYSINITSKKHKLNKIITGVSNRNNLNTLHTQAFGYIKKFIKMLP